MTHLLATLVLVSAALCPLAAHLVNGGAAMTHVLASFALFAAGLCPLAARLVDRWFDAQEATR